LRDDARAPETWVFPISKAASTPFEAIADMDFLLGELWPEFRDLWPAKDLEGVRRDGEYIRRRGKALGAGPGESDPSPSATTSRIGREESSFTCAICGAVFVGFTSFKYDAQRQA
jgi:hypothetical protein